MKTAYLGLGSNLGDRRSLLAEGARRLRAGPDIAVAAVSSIYESPVAGGAAQPDFLNLVLGVTTALGPHELLARCLAIEAALGRVRRERWGPRTLDIDLLWYEGIALADERLTLPHPRLRERCFVLVPLAEIAPAFAVEGETVSGLLKKLDCTALRHVGRA